MAAPPLFLAYLKRLISTVDRKIHLIVDGHTVHRRVSVSDWLTEHVDSIEMHFLPACGPELNPLELLNGDLNGMWHRRIRSTRQSSPPRPIPTCAAVRTNPTLYGRCSARQKVPYAAA